MKNFSSVYPLNFDGIAATSQAHGYDFVQADDFGGTVDVVMSDRAGNETSGSFGVVLVERLAHGHPKLAW
jgi:hypothetical protein